MTHIISLPIWYQIIPSLFSDQPAHLTMVSSNRLTSKSGESMLMVLPGGLAVAGRVQRNHGHPQWMYIYILKYWKAQFTNQNQICKHDTISFSFVNIYLYIDVFLESYMQMHRCIQILYMFILIYCIHVRVYIYIYNQKILWGGFDC